MRNRKRSRIIRPAAAAVATALALGTGHIPATAADKPLPAGGPGQPGHHSITLITGDRIAVEGGRPSGRLEPGPGRRNIPLSTFQTGGRHYVIPVDAAPLVGKGVLDRRLFDITGLIEAGYDDASRNSLPLLVSYAGGEQASATLNATPGATVTRQLPTIGAAAVNADKASATGLWSNITAEAGGTRTLAGGIDRIWLDGKRKASLDRSVPQIGAPAAWEAGYTGEGTTIAVLDTGVDQTHPDLADREKAERNFTDTADAIDHAGHGTFVASIAAGTGAKSGGKFTGVAPDATILDGKVMGDRGFGQDSWIIAGMEWAVAQGADIVNLSLSGDEQPDYPGQPENDPLEQAINTLSAEHGTLFVVAAGNEGSRSATVASPGTADAALTVGAVDRDDRTDYRSGRGPTSDGAVKPEIAGPGVNIVAALHSEGVLGPPVQDGYTALSGTSVATPHVAGAAALLAQQHPGLSGTQLKGLLIGSAKPTEGEGVFEQGAGRVDSGLALTQALRAEPATVNLGIQEWPRDNDQPVSKEIGFSNAGEHDATLDLRIEASGPDGEPAPEGVFTTSASRVTVPAGGKASVTITGDVRATDDDGIYGGTLVATSGEDVVRTPVSLTREPERYSLTLNYRDRTGAPARDHLTRLVNIDTEETLRPYDDDGSVTVRVPKGNYALDSHIIGSGDASGLDLLAYPDLVIDGDLTVELDARTAKPISVTPPNDKAEFLVGQVAYQRATESHPVSSGVTAFVDGEVGSAHLGPVLPPGELTALVTTQWAADDNASFYGLAWPSYGKVPTAFARKVAPGDLATVRASFGASPGRDLRYVEAYPNPHRQGAPLGWSESLPIPESGQRTEYYTGDGTDWNRTMIISSEAHGLEHRLESPPRAYQPGRTYAESFNRAVFGPALPVSYYSQNWVSRNGDTISAWPSLFGDASGNYGSSVTDSSSLRLFRNGAEVEGGPYFSVEPGEAAYRLTAEASRGNFELSTRVAVSWTFRSGTTSKPTRLPISTIRYFPDLDDNNAAPAGRAFVFPVAVQEQGSAVTKAPYKLSAEVSYDGGRTWRPATVLGNAQLLLHHPSGADTVSLRAKATDGNGNTVEQTIIDAYNLR